MLNAIYKALIDWNKTTNERQKLQHSYLVIIVVATLIAGLISLLDSSSGQDLLVVSVAAIGIFLANALLWSFLDSVVVPKLSNKRKKQ